MASALNPWVHGKLSIQFNGEALNRKSRKERNEYLTALRHRIAGMLEEERCAPYSLISGWSIELIEGEN